MAKKKKNDDAEDGTLVLFTSLSLIILTFFVYLSSISVIDNRRERVALGSLTGTFQLMPGGISPSKGSVLVSGKAPIISVNPKSEANINDLLKYVREHSLENEIAVSTGEKNIVINIADSFLFPSGSAKLQDSNRLFDEIYLFLKKTSYPIRIEGHTDNIPISSERYPSNWELSASRAVAVLRYLAERYDLPLDRLSAVGFGEYRPVASNNTIEGRAKNRRVEIILVGGGKERLE
ncbi:MAG: flagellar motor protein MotB [Nitrospirota bacterium]